MSIFASETTATVSLPFDAPHTVTVQKLTGRDLERAQADHMSDFVAGRSPRGWAALFQRAIREGTATVAQLAEGQRDPLAGFDRSALVRGGLKAWTYTIERDGKTVPRPIDVDDLDDEALEFIALEIMKLTRPWLFLTDEEAEAARKNG